jgi:hypothetical protein
VQPDGAVPDLDPNSEQSLADAESERHSIALGIDVPDPTVAA